MDSNSDHYGSALVLRRPQKGRMAALRDEPSKVSSQRIVRRLAHVDFLRCVCSALSRLLCRRFAACFSRMLKLSDGFPFRFSLLAFSLDFSDM